jgi:hypothetical protein
MDLRVLPVKNWAKLGTLVRQNEHDFDFIIPSRNGALTVIESHRAFLEARLPAVCGRDSFIPSWVQPAAFQLFHEVYKDVLI